MNKGLFALAAATLFSVAGQTQAKQKICVFDPMGKAGEVYKVAEEWALAAQNWQAKIQLVPYKDEATAQIDFEAGECEGVYMTSMRARKYNKFAGSIDAIGGVINNQVAKKAIHFALDKRNKRRLITTIDGDTFEVAGISQFGLAYIFVHDKSINSLAKAKGKKFAYLKHDDAQRKILKAIGMVGLPSDVSDFAKKFNTNQADVIASPAYAYKALEIEKGLGTIGAMFDNVPVVNITIELIIRPNSFPAGFSLNSREWFIQQIPTSFAMIKRLEDAIPTKYKYSISKEEVENYEKLFREQRIRFTKDGIYDPVMMGVLKRARCSVERTRFECSLGGE